MLPDFNKKFFCRYPSSNNAQITQSNGNNERVWQELRSDQNCSIASSVNCGNDLTTNSSNDSPQNAADLRIPIYV